ncbi:OmpA family protein [Kribbella pratensis]|uniref:OmpA family protein n=1 Tax=Kribbella pratensis TaxID=2512112 RepID=A0A4R8BWM3_9ACTN|nr:OmpA family protein [Kribbella pratensis]TDW66198.1 OmpA family protein [Kribbella pratensis]
MSPKYSAFRRGTAGAVAVAVASVLVACGHQQPQSAEPPPDVAVVVSVHRNAPKVPSRRILDALPDVTNGSNLISIGVDGSVDGVDISEIKIGTATSNDDRRKAVARAKVELGKDIDAAVAGSAESDPLGAIAVAARRLRGSAGDKTLIIADSLLPTAGQLQLQHLGFRWTTEDLWEQLSAPKPNNLPDLRDIRVKVIGLGQTTTPQSPLDEARTKQLEDLWRTILIRSGAKERQVEFVPSGVGTISSSSKYKVSVVPIAPPPPPPPPPTPCAEQVIPETIVSFQPDTATFVEPDAARAAAVRVATALAKCPGRLSVTGTTSSWGTEAGRTRVSTDRALAFRDLLADVMGVTPASILARGVGMHFCGYVVDRSKQGDLIARLAILNRTVRVTTGPPACSALGP